jgi:hypothetical protein
MRTTQVFPSIWEVLKREGLRAGYDVENIFFPPWAEEMCRELRWPLPTAVSEFVLMAKPGEALYVRNPTLIPIQLLGVLVGFAGVCLLVRGIFTADSDRKRSKEADRHWSRSLHWPIACFWCPSSSHHPCALSHCIFGASHFLTAPRAVSQVLVHELDVAVRTQCARAGFLVLDRRAFCRCSRNRPLCSKPHRRPTSRPLRSHEPPPHEAELLQQAPRMTLGTRQVDWLCCAIHRSRSLT